MGYALQEVFNQHLNPTSPPQWSLLGDRLRCARPHDREIDLDRVERLYPRLARLLACETFHAACVSSFGPRSKLVVDGLRISQTHSGGTVMTTRELRVELATEPRLGLLVLHGRPRRHEEDAVHQMSLRASGKRVEIGIRRVALRRLRRRAERGATIREPSP